MKAFVDKNTCIGCGLCPEICPKIFRMDDDG
ncbi:MAG TPA: ferredoxin, partial [Haloplasmataceae bacterium]